MATALIADPSAASRKAAQYLLETLGFEVAAACDVPEALGLIRGLSPDLILLDARLGEGDCGDLVERIRSQRAGLRACLFLVAANGASTSIRNAMDAGADDYLVRPFDRRLLAFKLSQARSRGRLTEERHKPRLVHDNTHSWRFRVFGKAV
ncbi:MAG: response regulator [Rhizobiales bacterium]|nr:response regulator [Hyphomicrobiales bacterium]